MTTPTFCPAALALTAALVFPHPATATPGRAARITVPSAAAAADDSTLEVLPFHPLDEDSLESGPSRNAGVSFAHDEWLRAPFGDNLLTDPDQWRAADDEALRSQLGADYNRVDRIRLSFSHQVQRPETMMPRVATRIEYAFGRERLLYGLQLEQPIAPPGRLALGVSMVRRTDHSELQQVDDVENSLALLFGRQDYRDYFEREGFGGYLSWRVPDFSTVSVHLRNDQFRSLPVVWGTRSWFQRDRTLRANPSVEEGEAHAAILRLERLAHRTGRTRAGLYHWIELERAGGRLEGDFDYTRLLGDVRSVMVLTPASSLALRLVGGHAFQGRLPAQKQFTCGGVDGLRAHPFAKYRGDELALAQAEYTLGLWRIRTPATEGGLHAIAFVDCGSAWSNPDHAWDVGRQHIQADGGFGLATSEDEVRVYFARDLQDPGSDFVISLRLQRPF
ncbi:MAG TPA: hypothetical protein VGK89_03290 [Candidatus Eisenbacteria bacterium]